MRGTEVELQDMLRCRELRVERQREFLSEMQLPLLSFSMNIPGPVKTNEEIRGAFLSGKAWLDKALMDAGFAIEKKLEIHEKTGDELLYAVRAEAEELKKLSLKIEEEHPLGRLFDMDVIQLSGEKLSRPGQRCCLICGKPAQLCAHSRAHSVPEMQERISELLREFFTMTGEDDKL